ncbi:MAG: response regulator [Bacteroidetes bacterium]|nr:response regulator [Bacteroidota bacterium]
MMPNLLHIFFAAITELEDIIPFLIVAIAIPIGFLYIIRKNRQQILDLEQREDEATRLLKDTQQLNKSLIQAGYDENERIKELLNNINLSVNHYVNNVMEMAGALKETNLSPEQQKNTDIIISCSNKLLEVAATGFNPVSTAKAATTIMNITKRKVVETEQLTKEFYKKYPLSILLAEDDDINQQISLRLLEKLGYAADLAHNGKEALDMVSERNYDVVLMDVQMPEMDGFEATKMIRVCLDTQPFIIALTASAMAGDKERCVQAGMNDYLCKPIRLNELAAILVKLCEEKNLVS